MNIELTPEMIQAMKRGEDGEVKQKLSSQDFQSFCASLLAIQHKMRNAIEDLPVVDPELSQRTGRLVINHHNGDVTLS